MSYVKSHVSQMPIIVYNQSDLHFSKYNTAAAIFITQIVNACINKSSKHLSKKQITNPIIIWVVIYAWNRWHNRSLFLDLINTSSQSQELPVYVNKRWLFRAMNGDMNGDHNKNTKNMSWFIFWSVYVIHMYLKWSRITMCIWHFSYIHSKVKTFWFI